MQQVAAQTIKEIKEAKISNAGTHFVMQMLDRFDQPVNVAIPADLLIGLMGQMATVHAQNWKILGLDQSFAHAFEVANTQVGSDRPNTGKTILTMQFGEAAISFSLTQHRVDILIEQLQMEGPELESTETILKN